MNSHQRRKLRRLAARLETFKLPAYALESLLIHGRCVVEVTGVRYAVRVRVKLSVRELASLPADLPRDITV